MEDITLFFFLDKQSEFINKDCILIGTVDERGKYKEKGAERKQVNYSQNYHFVLIVNTVYNGAYLRN